MLIEIHNFVVDQMPPEIYDTLEESLELIELHGVEGFEDVFVEVILTAGQTELSEAIDTIKDLAKLYLVGICTEHSVTLVDVLRADELNDLVRGLLVIQDYEDVGQLECIVQQGYSPEETFAELLSLVTSLTVEDLLLMVTRVSASLVRKIVTINQREEEDVVGTDATTKKELATKVLEYVRFVNGEQLLMHLMIVDGVNVGYPYQVYLGFMAEQLEDLSELLIAQNIIYAAMISKDRTNNLYGVGSSGLDGVITDINRITRIDIAVKQTLVAYEKHLLKNNGGVK